MKAVILNGAVALRDLADAAETELSAELATRGYDVVRHDLTALDIPDCKGDFGCWTITPGICVQPGPHRDVARDMIQSDLVVWLTPVTFGGYSSSLKRQLDHSISLISARFTTVGGETHHAPRYEHFPDLLVVGLLERPDSTAGRVFERLVRRNALNVYAPHVASPLLTRDALPTLRAQAISWLEELAASCPPSVASDPLDLTARTDLSASPPRRALLLVGSPRGQESVSAAIAAHLGGLLTERGLAVEVETITRHLRADPELHQLRVVLRTADVVALATPLYVDSLPAPVTRAFEILGEGDGVGPRPRFLAIVNSGFPEAVHNDTALAICRLFAVQARLDWIGGLAVGGGGMLAGRPLAELGPRARAVTRAFAESANAIAEGRVLPESALRLARQLTIPNWLYRFMADRGFVREAKKRGTSARLADRPYVT